MRKGGYICEVNDGPRIGLYCIVRHKEQEQRFRDIKKVYGHFFHDQLCQEPLKGTDEQGNLRARGLIDAAYLKVIGMVD